MIYAENKIISNNYEHNSDFEIYKSSDRVFI